MRSIRASERRIRQQITDIFVECSIDYDRDSSIISDFDREVKRLLESGGQEEPK